MLHTLVSHNEDIKRLVDKGYAVSVDSGYLVVRDVPYLDSTGLLQIGAIVTKIDFVDGKRARMVDHQIFFCGSHPHEINGTVVRNLGGGPTTLTLASDDLKVERVFSNKPPSGAFSDWFEKVESYVALFSGPAMSRYPEATPLTFRTVEELSNSVFRYHDTLTSRAEIGDLVANLADDVIAIIGLGGTGAYVLDFLSKTPVKAIKGFDADFYHVHNAYRSPGKLDDDDLGRRKADVYQGRYEGFRSGVEIAPRYVLSDSDDDLSGVTFAFVCVDKGTSRAGVFEALIRMKIPFIDVGMGLDRSRGAISGTMRTTYYPSDSAQDMVAKGLTPMHDEDDGIYKTNIQIAELNALNASLAVVRYKQLRGFYLDENSFKHMLLSVGDFHLVGDSCDGH